MERVTGPVGAVRHAREHVLRALDEAADGARSEALRWADAARAALGEGDAASFHEQAIDRAARAAVFEYAADLLRTRVAPGSRQEVILVTQLGLDAPASAPEPPTSVNAAYPPPPRPGPVSTRPTGNRKRSVA